MRSRPPLKPRARDVQRNGHALESRRSRCLKLDDAVFDARTLVKVRSPHDLHIGAVPFGPMKPQGNVGVGRRSRRRLGPSIELRRKQHRRMRHRSEQRLSFVSELGKRVDPEVDHAIHCVVSLASPKSSRALRRTPDRRPRARPDRIDQERSRCSTHARRDGQDVRIAGAVHPGSRIQRRARRNPDRRLKQILLSRHDDEWPALRVTSPPGAGTRCQLLANQTVAIDCAHSSGDENDIRIGEMLASGLIDEARGIDSVDDDRDDRRTFTLKIESLCDRRGCEHLTLLALIVAANLERNQAGALLRAQALRQHRIGAVGIVQPRHPLPRSRVAAVADLSATTAKRSGSTFTRSPIAVAHGAQRLCERCRQVNFIENESSVSISPINPA